MFSELKNWFRRSPPGPLKYMRLGPEGRDTNPLMVESFPPPYPACFGIAKDLLPFS